ncbi:MAG: FHA domain-containing protein [Comamonadaceae bacterium]|jgi:pSer/pThr/pTyr-binding forkhead associated (FHA) protein|nr:FHA domain-containing protein [Rhodoferax sp.]TSA12896.1 MAG: FHA domain-containing protein [Comamonadaceae bacterium]
MPKMIVSIDGVVIKEVQLTKDRTTLGRRPYNDIVIDNLAISGEHAVLQLSGSEVYLEDLNSTNGTYVNGKAAKKQMLRNGDSVEVGKYKIKFISDAVDDPSPKTAPAGLNDDAPNVPQAAIKVLSGAAAGRQVPLTKAVTTIGKPGIAVAAITRQQRGFVIHVEGAGNPSLNGRPFGSEPVPLKNGDLIELAGTQMQFVET